MIFRQFFLKSGKIDYHGYMKELTSKKKTIENSLKELNSTIYRVERRLERAPAETISVKNGRFYQINPDGSQEYIRASEEKKIKVLAQKKYDKRLLDSALVEREIFQRALKGFQKPKCRTLDRVLENFPEELKPYLSLDECTEEGIIQEWSKPIPPSINENDPNYELYRSYKTMKGEIVRSKSEIIIADHLNRAGVPYHYEKILIIDNGFDELKPDFTVLNTRTMKTYYWEHFGMMDNPEYAMKAKKKIESYAADDYLLGRDLIASFETSKSPVSIWYIDLLIEQFLK